MAFRLESNCVDGAIDLWDANHVCDEFAQPIVDLEIDRLETNLLGMGEPLLIHIANQHDSCAEDTRGRSCRESPTGPQPRRRTLSTRRPP